MSRTISAALKAHKALPATTTCRCWRIKRQDGTNEAWTEHDAALSINTGMGEGTLSYLPIPGGTPSGYAQRSDLSAGNLDIEMAYGPDATSDESLLRGGAYDYAEVWTFECNWANLAQGILKLAYGRLGQVSLDDDKASIECRGLAQLLASLIGDVYLPECRATFGDSLCKIDITPFTHTGTINVVTDNRRFTLSGGAAGQADQYYSYGVITFITGENAGLSMQVESYYTITFGQITLIEPMPFDVASGDQISITAGCNRTWQKCKTFVSDALQGGGTTEGSGLGNRKNFRGYPGLPGLDEAANVPSNSMWTSG